MVEESRLREGYKTTDLGIIPSDWEVVEVKEAYGIYNNLRLPISGKIRETMQGKYPYYGPTGIQDYINEYRLDGEYSLIGEDGDHFLKWRNMPMTLLVTGKFNVNNHAHVIKGLKNHTEWFYWYFYHRDITAHLSRQGAGRYKLNKRTLETLKMAIPSLLEQKIISDALMDTDNLIKSIENLIDKKKKIKQGAMQQLLTGKKRLPGFSGEWKNAIMKDFIYLQVGYPFESQYFNNNGIRLIRNRDLKSSDTKLYYIGIYEDSYVIKKGDLLVGMDGDFILKLWDEEDALLNQRTGRIRSKSNISLIYLYYALEKPLKDIENKTLSTTVKHLSHGDIDLIEIRLPEIQEQNAIAQVLSDMDAEIEALEEKLEKVKTIKQGMMQELLTGRIRLI
jgi:type I restriction enzyme S subunit